MEENFMEKLKEWEELLTKIILENVPQVEVLPPQKMVNYFLVGHRPKMIKSLELLDKYINSGDLAISVGSWISAIGLFFYLKCGMKSESISIDCNDWEVSGITKNTRKNLCFVDSLGTEKYDLVIEAEMFSHYPCNILAVLKKMVDACKENGIIHISVPLGNWGKFQGYPKDVNIKETSPDQTYHEHLRLFSKDEIVNIVKNNFPECQLLENECVVTPDFGEVQITIWRKTHEKI
jgi:predicted SAM-dependent methyltransferase